MATELKQMASTSAEPSADNEFVCACDENSRSACQGLPFYKEYEGKRYCVLHYPGKEKSADFALALQNKLEAKDFYFGGVWFPDAISFAQVEFSTAADFRCATFSADVSFSQATFKPLAGANFRKALFKAAAYFSRATYSADAFFNGARFSVAANFSYTTFEVNAFFSGAAFSAAADFGCATFSADVFFSQASFNAEADFRFATFSMAANFYNATFGGYVRFEGHATNEVFREKASLNLMHVRIEKPERISFHALRLRPHWFVNADARKFEFVTVRWDDKSLQDEIEALPEKEVEHPHRLLSIAYRQLAVNAEENHRYDEASRFRYDSMNVKRLEKWRGWAFWTLDWWYWVASGYGERVGQAFIALLLVLFPFAGLYTQVGFTQPTEKTLIATAETAQPDTVGKPLGLMQAGLYSLRVALLQKPEPKPLTLSAELLVILEMLLGPLQGALLALAVRRKFMR